ncbi:hypothetical protein DFQ28_003535 [Apophysomyces sp. BC1034]|nr:hypothetical protein DFQ30_009241 [Apophysomyces sp. BC1015]KAG0179077.1 hypothetical protein DFQ29_002656 [Apophysomyces sp. BC1021]KAG0189334.1 hypothetical protein DFQ28_003535 [Apophysomyces sp. BC1034]
MSYLSSGQALKGVPDEMSFLQQDLPLVESNTRSPMPLAGSYLSGNGKQVGDGDNDGNKATTGDPSLNLEKADIVRISPRVLHRRQEELTAVPPEVRHYHKLKELNLSSNAITRLSTGICKHVPQLEVLVVSHNRLQSIPSSLPSCLPSLVTLRLDVNLLDRLPNTIGRWQQLRHLQLGSAYGGNALTELPAEIADMQRLEDLDVSHNQLVCLPAELPPALMFLRVSDNRIESLPQTILNCTRLRTIDISKNRIQTLSASLAQLPELELLDASDNLLERIPGDIMDSPATILFTGNPLNNANSSADDDKEISKPPAIHSLRELAIRAILQAEEDMDGIYYQDRLPTSIVDDLRSNCRTCPRCRRRYVHEGGVFVQIRSQKGYPSVLRKARFCSVGCWNTNMQLMRERKSLEHYVSPPQRLWPGTFEWIVAAADAAAEQNEQELW